MKQSLMLTMDPEEFKELVKKCIKEELHDILHSNGNGDPQATVKLLGNREAADFLQISQRTLQTWRVKGIIPYMQIGGKLYYKKTELLEAIEKFRVK